MRPTVNFLADEHLRVFKKVFEGVGFFTSQVVYNVDNAIWFLQDYDELCKVDPRIHVCISSAR